MFALLCGDRINYAEKIGISNPIEHTSSNMNSVFQKGQLLYIGTLLVFLNYNASALPNAFDLGLSIMLQSWLM